MSCKNTIFLGDLIRVIKENDLIKPQFLNLAANALGFTIVAQAPSVSRLVVTESGRPNPVEEAKIPEQSRSREIPEAPGQGAVNSDGKEAGNNKIPPQASNKLWTTMVTGFKIQEKQMTHPVEPKSYDLKEINFEALEPLSFRPMIPARYSRGVLKECLSFSRESRNLEIRKTVFQLARLSDPSKLWLKKERGSAARCHILADVGKGMAPFKVDRAAFIQKTKLIMGSANVEIYYFKSNPRHRMVSALDYREIIYQKPHGNTPIILLSDLGITRVPINLDYATTTDWLEFFDDIKHSACRIIVLTPYPANRIPSPLRSSVPIIQWDNIDVARNIRNSLRQIGWG